MRLAAIPNVVGVKEASGNITQMAEICRAVPPDFVVVSGDDAITLPLMAIGGRGVISVASNLEPIASRAGCSLRLCKAILRISPLHFHKLINLEIRAPRSCAESLFTNSTILLMRMVQALTIGRISL